MTNDRNNRTNRLIDNNIDRVVARARKYGFHPIAWQVVDTHERWAVTHVEDTVPFERANVATPGRYLFTPVFDRSQVDFNGNPCV